MQCATACSTCGSWSSSHTLVCGVLSRRDPASGLRTSSLHPFSFVVVEKPEKCFFFSQGQYHHSPVLIHILSGFHWNKKSIRNSERTAAPIGVFVPYEPAAGADDLTRLPSTYSPRSSSNRSSHIVPGSPSEARIPVREQIVGRPAVEWRQWSRVSEEVRAIVGHFLQSRGLSSTVSEIAVKKAPTFITHLLSLLRSCYPSRYLSGKDLTETEIRCVLLPYLESLGETHTRDGDGIVNDSRSVPSVPDLASFVPRPEAASRILSGYPLLHNCLIDGRLPPSLSYCLSIGLTPAQLEATVKKFPPIVGYSLEGKIEKVVDFILSLDVPSSLIPLIVLKRPQLFGCNVEENLRPSVAFLEHLGVERRRWGKILVSFPHVLTYSCTKSTLIFNFLLEIGVSHVGAGKILSRFPHAVGYSVELKLKPMAAYFQTIGVQDFSRIITRSPQILGLSLEGNIKPTIHFFMSTLGFSMKEIALVLHRFPPILGLNVEHNLQPKWHLFLEMNRCKAQLLDFPQYFGYSLEKRILPRYKIVKEKRLTWTLNRMLSSSAAVFHRLTNT